jgi:hypothetical protein
VAALCSVAGWSLLVSAPALAAPPETPELKVEPVFATVATFRGVLSPKASVPAEGTYKFLYKASKIACEGGSETTPGLALGGAPEVLPPEQIKGLTPATEYTVCLSITNPSSETAKSAPVTFTTPTAAPVITEEAFSTVGSTTATVNARINPGALPTTYRVEYGTTTGYGSSTPDASAGAGHEPVSVQVQLSGLQPGTVYHARVDAANELGAIPGGDLTFTTLGPTGPSASTLPDNRVYEMVSPVTSENRAVYIPRFNGNDITSSEIGTEFPFQAASGGNAVAYVGDPSPGGAGLAGEGTGNEYLAVRGSAGGWTARDIVPTALKDNYQGFTSDLSLGVVGSAAPPLPSGEICEREVLFSRTSSDGSYHRLFTVSPTRPYCGEDAIFAGGSADGAHLVFEAEAALTPNAPEPGVTENLYDSASGQLSLVNVLPNGTPEANAVFGSPVEEFSDIGPISGDFRRVVSADGSLIFWTDLNNHNLYVREHSGTPEAVTVQVDAAVGGGGQYWTATVDGSKAFFTKSGDLYAFDVNSKQTSDLVPGGEVQGIVGASEDGSYLYFVASGALAGGATAGQPNLYLRHGGITTFITTLGPADSPDWSPGFFRHTAQVTPDGHNVLFFEKTNPEIVWDRGKIFVYAADPGKLLCVSCNSGGGGEASLDGASTRVYSPRWISADGSRVFFQTKEALSPQDTNGLQDVYEWERAGAGTCLSNSGCIYLLSGGTSNDGSYFVDASADGNDVFLATRGELVPPGPNGNVGLYDARVDGLRALSPPACTGTGCQGVPPAPPTFATPSSATFNGLGNYPPSQAAKGKTAEQVRVERLAKALKACRMKHNKQQRQACEKAAHKKYDGKVTEALKACRMKHNKHKRQACEEAAHKKYDGKVTAKKAKIAKRASNNRRTGR